MVCLAICLLTSLCACGGAEEKAGKDDETLHIVTTIFPEYDWTRNILGENPGNAEVTLLLDSGVDPHSFQATTKDILDVSTCDLFVYVGGESDEWAEDALAEAVNPDMVVINLLEVLGDQAKTEERTEGMQGRAEEEPELDEHVWLSLRNAEVLCGSIEEGIAEIDPEHADIYEENLEDYLGKLDDLDQEYIQAMSDAPVKTVLFGDRFPFRYLTEDYGLSYYAAFSGCSAETEASFQTIRFLAGKLDKLRLPCVLTIEGSDKKIAETIIQNTESQDQEILVLDSMQSVTLEEAEEGASYIGIMKENLATLQKALR